MKNNNEPAPNYFEILGKIKGAELFSDLNDETLMEFLDYVMIKKYQLEDIVIKENDLGNTMFFIIEGEFVVEKDGKVITEIKNGDFFGEMSLLTGDKRSVTVKSKSQGLLIEIDIRGFQIAHRKRQKNHKKNKGSV